jgi:ribosomal protein S4E
MTDESFRAVLRVNGKTFTSVAHNLSAEKAEAKLNELKNKGVQTQVLFQTSRHKGRGFKNCELCKNAAENLSQKAATGLAEEDHTNDAVAETANQEQ